MEILKFDTTFLAQIKNEFVISHVSSLYMSSKLSAVKINSISKLKRKITDTFVLFSYASGGGRFKKINSYFFFGEKVNTTRYVFKELK